MTGFHQPTTPGSSTVGDVRIRMSDGTVAVPSQGMLAPMAARIWRHPFTRLIAIAASPHNHTPKSDGAIQSGVRAAATATVVSSEISANGSLNPRTAGDVITEAIVEGACLHSRKLPAAANTTNGTRNLIEAANHRP